MKRTLSVLCFVLLLVLGCGGRQIVRLNFPERFEGLTQLVLASETTNVSFTEDVSKSLLAIFKSHASVRVQSSVTYDFYVDFQEDGYEAKLDKSKKILQFYAPPIRVKKPVINQSTVSYPETGLFVNEKAEAIKILENLTDRFVAEGETLLKQDKVFNMCSEKLEQHMLGLCKQFDYDVEQVEVYFHTEE